jgi:methyltransferase-like protein/ubiquinone/menaquinone biosynthesis C-methylase UbiE
VTSRPDLAGQYDQTPYDSRSFPQSHPDRLAVLGRLFGLQPAAVDRCRVLELGCATGGNLIPMASTLPDSRFVGIDISPQQVAMARSECQALGLGNIEIHALDLLDVDDSLGTFDYIVAHGVYSWVPAPVRDRLLAVCGRHLSPSGIAYVSYNTYPGWTVRRALRDLMLYFVDEISEPAVRAAQARSIIKELAGCISDPAYAGLVMSELETMRKQSNPSLLHDQLEDWNHPVYFHQFIEHAGQHGLQYLAEADFGTMLLWNLPLPQGEAIQHLTDDPQRMEQYMDLVTQRAFRQTLLCRQSVSPEPARGDRVPDLHVAASRPAPGATMAVTRAAFEVLAEVWPQSLAFNELLDGARQRLGVMAADSDAELLGNSLLAAYGVGAVVLRARRADFTVHVGERPQASRLSRWQARQLPCVTNQLHENVRLDLVVRAVLRLLDGQRDRPQLLQDLVSQVQAGRLVLDREGRRLRDEDEIRGFFIETLDSSLPSMARNALLIS